MDTDPPEPRTLAEEQIAAAQRDPRLDLGRRAFVADWWAAFEAVENTRTTSTFAADTMRHAVELEELKAGVSAGDPDLTPSQVEQFRAARERAAMAQALIDSEFVELNAMTLTAMLGALDALVEGLVPDVRALLVEEQARRIVEDITTREPKLYAKLSEKMRDVLIEGARALIEDELPALKSQPRGPAPQRWEKPLSAAGLGAPPDRALPVDLSEALNEIVALRHVLMHRASRVDGDALHEAPTLRYSEDDLVRVTRSDYRAYSAALWTFGAEVVHRLMPFTATQVNLNGWRDNALLNT